MTTKTKILALAAAAAATLAPERAVLAASLAPAKPAYEVVLTTRDIVVQAKVLGLTGTSRRSFAASPGEVSKEPAFEETYETHRLRSLRLLKGKLPPTFEVRVLRGHDNARLLEEGRGHEMLLVLAPDAGRDEQGRSRRTYLVVNGAASLLRDGQFLPPRAAGSVPWSVQRVAEVLAIERREQAHRLATSPETPRAATMRVTASELNRGRPEPALPSAPPLRKGETQTDESVQAEPKRQEGAGDPRR